MNKEIRYHCDSCGTEYTKQSKCIGCNKNTCRSCRTYSDYNPFTFTYEGDYAVIYCKSCNEELEKIKPQIDQAHLLFDQTIKELELTWLHNIKK